MNEIVKCYDTVDYLNKSTISSVYIVNASANVVLGHPISVIQWQKPLRRKALIFDGPRNALNNTNSVFR